MKKNYRMLIPLFAVALLLMVNLSSAFGTIDKVEFNGVDITGGLLKVIGSTGSSVPVVIQFTATADAEDVEVEVEIKGYRGDVSKTAYVGYVEDGTTLTKVLNLELPSSIKERSEDATVYVTVYSKTAKVELSSVVRMQRESYEISVLSMDYTTQVSAGDVVPVAVVLKNTGYGDLEDNYVIVSIPALDISTRGYVGDLVPLRDRDFDNSVEKVVFLQIPAKAETGIYDVVVEAYSYDDDAKTTKTSMIAISGVEPSEEDETLRPEKETSSNSIIALTIVLAVVFVALLVVLIVLITKKDKTFEEVETSYY